MTRLDNGFFIFLLIVVVFVIELIIPYLIAKSAREKGRSFGGFFLLSIFFTPIIGGLILALMGKNEEKLREINLQNGVTKICPYCANEINSNAKLCMFCHKELMAPEKIEEIIKKDEYIKDNFTRPYIVLAATEIKETPDTNANTIMSVNTDEVVDFLSDAYDDVAIKSVWYKVKYKQAEGWCLSKCLRKHTP